MVDPTVDDSFSTPGSDDYGDYDDYGDDDSFSTPGSDDYGDYDDYDDDASTETPADKGSYSLREVKDNPHLSLVKYNMTAGSPITQFFSDFDENSVDPFSAATKFSSTFFRKMQAEDAAADNMREVRAKLFIQQQADRLQSSIRSYDLEMQQATTYRLLSTTPTSTTSPTSDLYNPPTGFVPRPTHYDLYSLLASQETRSLSLRSSMYEIHNNYYVAALQQRSGSNELITQTYTSNGVLPTAGNESSMRILLGNDIAAKVLREQNRTESGKSPTTIKTVSGQGHSFSLHAKVGYFQDDSGKVHSAFISTQNPTHTLARAHTTEEMLVLTSKSILDSTEPSRARIRSELIENIKDVTDSIHDAFDDLMRSTPGVSVDAMRQHLSLTNPRELVGRVTAYYRGRTYSRRANQSVFVGEEIQQQIANRLQRIAGDKGGSKVVLSIQYLETLLIQNGNSTKMTASSLASSGGDDYNTRIRTPLLRSIKSLAEQGRISIGLAGSSYGTQGLFSLLDRYYDDSLPDTDPGKQTVAALIENKAFSVLPTRFAHSKSFAAYDDKGLTMFGIGSSNISKHAYENNLEVSMILDTDSGTLGGLTDKEQQDILSYYKYGVSNFESKNVSSPTERKGSEKQTRELINLLKSMGGKQTRDSSGVDSDFTFSVRYSQDTYKPIGLDIKINSINKELPGYSFSVTVGEEQGLRGAEPIVYLSKTNKVINGMTYVNNSSKVLELYGGNKIQPGEAVDLNALDVVAGLITTMRHMLTFEATRGSLNKALNTMSFDNKTSSIDKILGVMLHQQLRLSDTGETMDNRGETFTKVMSRLIKMDNIDSSEKIAIVERMVQRLISIQEETTFKGLSEPDLNVRRIQLEGIFSRKDIIKAFEDTIQNKNSSRTFIRNLTTLLESSRLDSKNAVLYSDILRLMVKSDQRAENLYLSNMANVKKVMFNQITSPFMQPHELRYSMGQALLKRPVYGINDELYELASLQSTINNNQGVILSPHDLHHGEILQTKNGTFIRGKADHRRITQNLYEQQGGIYNVDEGATSIRHTNDMMQVMRGLSLIDRKEYEDRVRASLSDSGLTEEDINKTVEELSNELFSLNRIRTTTSNQDQLLYFPYRVPEQVVERLRNLQSTRPVESASRNFANYVDTLGALGNIQNPEDDTLTYSNIISGDYLTTIAPHQFKILKDRIDKKRTEEGRSREESADDILTDIRQNEYGNSQTLLRGFLGGQAPKRVLQSVGVSSMSDFSYVNEDFRYDRNKDTSKPEYVQFHTTSISLDQSRLLTSTSFKENVTKNLKRGTTFIHKDQKITHSSLKSALETRAVNIASHINSLGAADLITFARDLSGKPLSQTLIKQIEKYKQSTTTSTLPSTFEELASADKQTIDLVQKLISLEYESVQLKAAEGSFYFKGGVYSPADSPSSDILDKLKTVRKIGDINVTGGYFTLDAFKQYDQVGFGSQQRRTSYIPFKITATSAREYRGVSVLVEDAFIDQSGASSLQLHLQTATRRDMVSNLRPGSDTSKGPSIMVKGALFNQLREEQEHRGLHTLLSKRIQKQDIYAILSSSQIKGFNFEQGLMLIEDEHSPFMNKVLDPGNLQSAKTLAEGLALLMLSDKGDGDKKILSLLAQSFRSIDNKSQAYRALTILSQNDSFASKSKLPTRKNNNSITEQIGPTYSLFGELVALALPEFIKRSSSPSQALIDTVAAALDSSNPLHTQALQRIQAGAEKLFKLARSEVNSIKVGDRYTFNDATTRTASLLAIATKFSQDIFTDINTKARLEGDSISELNPAYLLENIDVYTNPVQDFERALVKSVQVAGSMLNIHLPSPEEISRLTGDEKARKKEELKLGLYQLNTILRFNRFLEFGMEQMPSRVAVAMGMQNMTKMEGQYMYELNRSQMGLFTDMYKENADIATIQQAVLMLGSIAEGELLDPIKARTKYKLSVDNLAFRGISGLEDRAMELLFGKRYAELNRLYGELDKARDQKRVELKQLEQQELEELRRSKSPPAKSKPKLGRKARSSERDERAERDKDEARAAAAKETYRAEREASDELSAKRELNIFSGLQKDKLNLHSSIAISYINTSPTATDIGDELTDADIGRVSYDSGLTSHQNEMRILTEIERLRLIDNEGNFTIYRKPSNINKLHDEYYKSPIWFTSKYLTSYNPYSDQDLPLVIGDRGKNNLSLSTQAIAKYIQGDFSGAERELDRMAESKKLFLSVVESSSDAVENNLDSRVSKMKTFMLEKLLTDGSQLSRLTTEVNTILSSIGSSSSSEDVINSRFAQHKANNTLMMPESYYKSFLTEIVNMFASRSSITEDNLRSALTEDLLDIGGVYKHYREGLENRIKGAMELSYGAEYVDHGLNSLKQISSTALKTLQSRTSSEDQKRRAQGVYDQVTKTRIVSLPALSVQQVSEGKYKAFYAPDMVSSSSYGIVLGLDLLQKLSLVFQTQTHEALSTQIQLIHAISESQDLINKLTNSLMGSSDDRLADLTEYELRQYANLQELLIKSQTSTISLLSNQETIRQAGVDRLKLTGVSSIAMSSLLLNSDEIVAGSKFIEVAQQYDFSPELKSDISQQTHKLIGEIQGAKNQSKLIIREGEYDLTNAKELINTNDSLQEYRLSSDEGTTGYFKLTSQKSTKAGQRSTYTLEKIEVDSAGQKTITPILKFSPPVPSPVKPPTETSPYSSWDDPTPPGTRSYAAWNDSTPPTPQATPPRERTTKGPNRSRNLQQYLVGIPDDVDKNRLQIVLFKDTDSSYTERSLEDLRSDISELDVNIESLNQRIAGIDSTVNTHQSQLSSYKENLKQNQQRRNTLRLELRENLDQQINEKDREIQSKTTNLQEDQAQLNQTNQILQREQSRLKSLRNQLKQLSREKASVENMLATLTGSNVNRALQRPQTRENSTRIAEHQSALLNITNQINDLNTTIASVQEGEDRFRALKTIITEDIESTKSEIGQLKSQKNQLRRTKRDVSTLNDYLNDNEEYTTITSAISNQQRQIQNVQRQIEESQTAKKGLSRQVATRTEQKGNLEQLIRKTPQIAYAYDPVTGRYYPQPHGQFTVRGIDLHYPVGDNRNNNNIRDIDRRYMDERGLEAIAIEPSLKTQNNRNTAFIRYLSEKAKQKDRNLARDANIDLYSLAAHDEASYTALKGRLAVGFGTLDPQQVAAEKKLSGILPDSYEEFDRQRRTVEFILNLRYQQEGYTNEIDGRKIDLSQSLAQGDTQFIKHIMNYMNYVNYSSYFIAKDEVSTFYITPDEVSTLNTELFQLTVPELQARIAEASITPETARILSAPRLLSRFRLRDDPYTRSSRRAQQQLDIDSGGWFYDFTPEEAISAFESLRTLFTDQDQEAIQAYYAENRYGTQATPLINIARRLLSQNDSSALQKLVQLKQATQNYSGDFDANILREYGSKSTKQLRADIQKYTQQVSNLKTKGDRLNQELQAIRILSATGLLSRFRLSDDLYTPSSKRAQQQLDIDRGGWSYEFSPEEAISAFERLRTRFTNEDQDAIQAYYAINRYSTQATPLINIAERLLHEKNPLFRKARILSATGLLSRFRLRDDPYTPSSKRAQQQLDIDRKDWSYDFTPEEAISAFERLRTLFTNEDQDAIQAYYAINRYSTQATPLINIAQRLLSQNDSLVYTSPVLQRLIQQNQDKLTQATLNKRAAEHVLSVRDNTLDMLRIISPELSRQIDLPSKTYKEKTPASAQKGIDKPIRVNNPRSAKEFVESKVIIKNYTNYKGLKSRLSEIKAQLSADGLSDEERNTLATEKSTVEQQIKQLKTKHKVRTISGKVQDYAEKIHKKRETLNSLEADDPDRVKLEQEIEDLTRKGESLDNADRELEQAINLGRKSTPGEVYTREMAKVDLDEHAKEYTKIKREYLKNMGEFSELSDELIITKDYLGPIYSIDEKGISYQSRALVDEYILDLILATTTGQMSSAKTQFIARIGDSQQKTKEERQAADKESRERMHAKLERVTPTLRATMTRSGGPSGTSLESETGTELKKVKTVPQFQQDAHQSGTLVVPGDSGTNTLMLMSALGNHYTQLGDNDGDSFQSAVTQMAVLTRRIRESENQLQELVNKDRELRRQPIPGEASLTSDLREKEIQEKRAELVKVRKHYEDMQKQYSLLLKNSQSKAQKGIRTYAKIYSALPEELLNDEIIKDLHLKSFVKQFRETLGGLSDNTASVNRATQNILTPDVLLSIQLSAPSPGKSLVDQVRDGELEFTIDDSSEWLRKYDGEEREQKKREAIEKFSQYVRTITESDTEYIGTLQGITDGSSVLSFLRQRVIEEISQATNIDAAITTTVGKPLKSAFGSVLNDDILQELQSIIGTSTGGLLGTTYNTVVPLISFQLANIGALKALKSTDDKSYRLALAASLMAKKPLELGEVRTFFEERETELLTGTLRSKTIIANIEAEKSIQTALRFIITTQQFIRDAGLKPKEPKGGSSSNKPSSLLESFASYQMLDENRAEYNLTDSAYDGQLKGLHKIFKAIEEANSPEDATVLREKFLQHYLSTEVGDKLDVNNPGDSSDERLVSLRTFGALQLLTDYLSGKYTSATDLINNSPLSKALTAAKVTKKYSGQADDDFVQSFITDLFLNFQDIYTSGQTSIDIGNRQEQVSSVDRIIESYGLSKDGSRLADYDDKIELMVVRHLQGKGFDLSIASDTDLEEYRAKYKREIEGRSMAVEQALKSLGSAATDDQIYEATMKAVTSHNIRSSYDDFKGGLKQLKQLHHALKQMRDNNIPGQEKLEQELSLYTQLFANRVASGHTDLNLWSGFFGTMMSSVANLSNPEDEESINSLRMSLLGLSGSLFDLPETAEGDQDSLRKAFLAASMHTPTAEEKYNLARKYTETQYGDAAFSSLPDLDFSSADTEDGKTSLLRSGVEGLKALITAPLASAEEEYSKYTNFVNTIDQIRDLDPSKSAIDYASETNSFTFALRQLSGEYLEIANNLKTPENFSSEAQKEMEDRARALEAMLVDPTNNKNQLLTELRRLHYSEEDAEKVTAQLEQEINAVIREQTDKANSITRQKLAENVGRINAVSEGISILAIPALFALMESPEDSIGQISSGLNEAYQALISSPVAMGYSPHVAYSQQDITKNQLYAESINRGMQVSRIRSQIRNNDSIATGMFTGLMFETLYKTSSKVTQHVANFISDIDPEFNNSVRGRFATEVMGGIFGMVAANFLVNRQIGLPQEDFTELNNALIIIDQIRQATQAAFNSFSDAIVSSINDPVEASDSESSSYEGSARFTEDAALTFEQRQEVTGAIEIYFEDQA